MEALLLALTLITAPAVEPLTVAEAALQLRLDAGNQEPAPLTAPACALAAAGAGNVDNGAHRYGVSFVTAQGETEPCGLSEALTVVDKTVNGKVNLTAIATGGAAVTARKLWRTIAGGSTLLYLATISDNSTTTYLDNIADASLGAAAPSTNTTSDPELLTWIAAVRERAELSTSRALITQSWDYILDAFPREGYVEIPKPPLQAIRYVRYVDTQGVTQTLAPTTGYLTQAPAGPRCARGRIALPFAAVWPVTLRQMGAVTIGFDCGYGNTPASVPGLLRSAMKLDLGTFYENREAVVLGLRGSPEELPMGSRAIYWSYKSHPTQRIRGGWAA